MRMSICSSSLWSLLSGHNILHFIHFLMHMLLSHNNYYNQPLRFAPLAFRMDNWAHHSSNASVCNKPNQHSFNQSFKETQYANRQLYVCMMHLEVCIFIWLLFEPGFTGNSGGVGFPLGLVLCSEYICSRHEPIIPPTPNYSF